LGKYTFTVKDAIFRLLDLFDDSGLGNTGVERVVGGKGIPPA
jgi:hypothetical protein